MFDTIEHTYANNTQSYCPEGDGGLLAAQAMVPMLDWPSDLFNTFTADLCDDL
jgi:hypothetical protein